VVIAFFFQVIKRKEASKKEKEPKRSNPVVNWWRFYSADKICVIVAIILNWHKIKHAAT
jgi:hypothetical protein